MSDSRSERHVNQLEEGTRRAWLWPLLLMVVIFFASGQSSVPGPGIVNFDKAVHAAVFGLLATLVARTQPSPRHGIGLLVAAGYGLVDEFRQSFTPGRSVEVADWLADAFGATAAVLLYHYWPAYRMLLERPMGRRVQPRVASGERAVRDSAR